MRAVLASIAAHVALLVWLAPSPAPRGVPPRVATLETPAPPAIGEITLVDVAPGGGGAPAPAAPAPSARRAASAPRGDAWQQVTVRMEPVPAAAHGTGDGARDGTGTGTGTGDGTGDGNGHGHSVRIPQDVPAPPPPPAPPVVPLSQARPATLVFPRRDREVEDEDDLFIARVTVDRDGDVTGARMVKTRPGVRGDQAASAIWTFRYLPALDDDGRAITSTFEQPFQIAH